MKQAPCQPFSGAWGRLDRVQYHPAAVSGPLPALRGGSGAPFVHASRTDYVQKSACFTATHPVPPQTCRMTDDTAPHRRLSDRGNGAPTIIGVGVIFRGDVIAPGSVMLSGAVRGDGDIGGSLQIARDAHWEGQVRAGSAVIAGQLTGSIECSGPLEVGAAAVIRGSVTAKSLAVANGGVIEGEIHVTSGAKVVTFEEKRKRS